jgi:ceramide glucosyltransferase
MTLPSLVALIGALVLADVAWSHRRLQRAVREARPLRARLARYPSITVIRPVRGHDVEAAANFAAALDTGYPGEVETIFLVDDESDPALPILREAVARHQAAGAPGRAAVLVAGAPPAGRTGKLNAMMVGLAEARGELVAFGDSDTRPDRQVLRCCVEALLQERGAGSSFAPVVVTNPPRTAGDAGYALLINALYGPSVAVASRPSGDVPFIMGQLMVLRRSAIHAIGGLNCADGQFVDDMHIGLCLSRAGLRNVQASRPLHIVTGGLSLYSFLQLYRRWLTFSRSGLPSGFTWPLWQRGIELWVALVAMCVALGAGQLGAALLPAFGILAFAASLVALQREFGGAPLPLRHAWMALSLFVISPLLLLSCLLRRQVEWRGRAYRLDAAARLAG